MHGLTIGDFAIGRVTELEFPAFPATVFLPAATDEMVAEARAALPGRISDDGKVVMSFHSFVLKTGRHTILIDTCCGKPRPSREQFDTGKMDYLAGLAAQGVRPEEVTHVMYTHLHWDHVGWNTQLKDGRWVPTFPNAKYIFGEREVKAWEDLHSRDPQPHYVDSILPILEAKQAQLVQSDFALDDEVWLEPSPGHTPDHMSICLASQGQRGVVTGDLIHNPVQCLEPQWKMRADFDADRAIATRKTFLDTYCESDVVVCATHFPEPSFGRVTPRGDAFWFEYEQ